MKSRAGFSGCMMAGLIALVVLIVLGIGGCGWYVSGYNTAVGKHQAAQSAWAQVESQLQRRYDLIPNLVETVKGYAQHERELFDRIAAYRTQYFQAQGTEGQVQAANQLESVLSRLLVLQERYPELKANENFLRLQDELAGTENRIAVERRRYNQAVQDLQTYGRSFFGRFFVSQAGVDLSELEYFEAPEAAATPPQVRFDQPGEQPQLQPEADPFP